MHCDIAPMYLGMDVSDAFDREIGARSWDEKLDFAGDWLR